MKPQRHVVHLLYRFAAGGLENVIVQLVNGLPHDQFRHTIVALTEAAPAFIARIERTDVEIIALHKSPGQPFNLYPRMYSLLRRLRPDVLHTCNIAALEFMPVAALAGVPRRIHAEHGWDVSDPDGSNRRYRLLRRLYRRFVQDFIVVSAQLQTYLLDVIHVPAAHVHLIENGVDCERFRPWHEGDGVPEGWPFNEDDYVIGTVGRLQPIKHQALLIEAFTQLLARQANSHLRLAVVGDGPLREALMSQAVTTGIAASVWMPGSRDDVADILRMLDCFVLPSLAEGTSCTLQEAMATALPIIATDVGGNRKLLADGALGRLVESDQAAALCAAMAEMLSQPSDTAGGAAMREHLLRGYSLQAMLARYARLFTGE